MSDKETTAVETSNSQADVDVFNTVDEAIRAIADGEMIIVVDDSDRENEGDLIMGASAATPEQIAFMIRHTSGILCTPLPADLAKKLQLGPMVPENDAPLQTAFTISVDYKMGLTTGISADERTNTIRAMSNNNVSASDFVRPGHVFPLVAKEGGVLIRSGHTEAAVDLARLAGLAPVGVLAELVNDDGKVKRLPELLQFAEQHGMKIISIDDLIAYRQQRERLVRRVAQFEVKTAVGPARAIAYSTQFDALQHLALVFGDIASGGAVPVRIHRESIIHDVFGSRSDPEQDLIARSMARFKKEGRGVLLYLREGAAGVPAEALQADDDSVNELEPPTGSELARDAYWREVGVGAQILRDLGIDSIKLLALRKLHYIGLEGFGIELAHTELLNDED
ncbi:MAG: 3,4-dihydroxy-2-butanone-4-phosphate synthase [Gammaproteobacteria bacterium]|nr:3,4-dihydroxy-2-butanone-4-phosphate synthase [Gammaproteobacteria bacterium]